MDPILVASNVKQSVYFIAAGEYVGKGVKGYIFRKWLHMIPVFRPSTRPEDVHKNKDMFNHCFDHLSKGGALLIFPEGVSVTERKIKPFKTGVARIAIGAELINQLKLNVHIVPVGLNYSNPHQFRSDVYVKIGEAIKVKDYIAHQTETNFSDVETLTTQAEKALHRTTIHVDSDQDDALLEKLHMIYSRDLKHEMGIDSGEQEIDFKMQREMLEAINYFRKKDERRFSEISEFIDDYIEQLNAAGLTDKDIKELKFQKSFRRIGSFLLGFPIFCIGVIGNFIPYFLVQFILKRIRFHENFQGSMILAAGLIVFFLFYVASATLLWIFTPLTIWSVFAPAIMYVTGIYAQLYLAAITYSSQRRNLRSVAKKNQTVIEKLLLTRKQLIQQLENCRVEFEKSTH